MSLQSVRKETRVVLFHSCTFICCRIHFTRLRARGLTLTPSGGSRAINHSWQRLQAFQPHGRKIKKNKSFDSLTEWQSTERVAVLTASVQNRMSATKQLHVRRLAWLGLWLDGVCRCLRYQRCPSFHPVSVRGASAESIKVSWSVSAPVVHRSARRSAKAPFAILIIFELAECSHFPHPLPSRVHRCRKFARVNRPFLNAIWEKPPGQFEPCCKKNKLIN